MSWTDDRVALLKKLWSEGKTAAEIAKELGDVSRNAVIGKAHRLKLSSRVSPIQQNNKKVSKPTSSSDERIAPRKIISAASPKADPLMASRPAKGDGVSLEKLEGRMCRWPIGDPREAGFKFCGCETEVAGVPYCDEHIKVAYQTSTRSRALQAKDFDNIDQNVKKIVSA